MAPPDRVLVSAPPNVIVSAFARLAQACNLLGRVIRHCNEETLEPKFALEDMTLLYNTITSLLNLLPENEIGGKFSSPAAVCFW